MKLINQVANLELSQKLENLGVKQESLWYWCFDVEEPYLINRSNLGILDDGTFYNQGKYASAFTVAELGEMLPMNQIEGYKNLVFFPSGKGYKTIEKSADTEANARTKMLIYLIENGLIKV